MIEIFYDVNGKRVKQETFEHSLDETLHDILLQAMIDLLQERIRGIKCPVHGESPEVTFTVSKSDKMMFVISGCCDLPINLASEIPVQQ